MKRRNFIKSIGIGLVGAPLFFVSKQWKALEAFAADADPVFAKETDEAAKNLKYCIDADKSIKAKKSVCEDRKKKEKATQYCHNCQLFQLAKGTGKAAEGKCLILPGKSVHGGGWCMSWVQKPA
jgi:hypothetical protein